ncbi:MAG: hypothetical protein ACI9NT_002685 [Bacteroidia bacterium]|jgi:uncharacterized protein (DUF2147 family)
MLFFDLAGQYFADLFTLWRQGARQFRNINLALSQYAARMTESSEAFTPMVVANALAPTPPKGISTQATYISTSFTVTPPDIV